MKFVTSFRAKLSIWAFFILIVNDISVQAATATTMGHSCVQTLVEARLGTIPFSVDGEFLSFYEATYPKALSISLRILRNKHDAEDVLQNSYLKIYNSWSSFRGTTGPQRLAWMFTFIRNECISWARYEKRYVPMNDPSQPAAKNEQKDQHIPPELVSALTTYANPELVYSQNEMDTLVKKALENIPDEMRKAVILRYIDGYTIEETMAMLHKSRQTIKNQASRGLVQLKFEFRALSKKKNR